MIEYKTETVSSLFLASTAEIDTIFESFRTLHAIYSASLSSLEKSLDDLPLQYKNQVKNARKSFKNTLGTVEEQQIDISNQLYAQALVLLVGSAESLTREMFYTLLRRNIRKIKFKKSIDIPLTDVLATNTDDELADVILGKLEAESNPAEKLNFQNMRQLQGIMKGYLGFEIGDDLIKDLHKFWQIRHVIIHNALVIDKQFINNLTVAGLSTDVYSVGKKITVTKSDYESCFGLLVLLFEAFDGEVERLQLRYTVE